MVLHKHKYIFYRSQIFLIQNEIKNNKLQSLKDLL